ncbi:MAG TPA: pyruvate dehydrogenase complex dihydrolipoamide acetyltransferase [Alphaproteobacteria bacterium]|nr:pyruvate dehydrogenase complex dihydrolipoamide acetyltransferase [Alphaproteobacteria bacterium]
MPIEILMPALSPTMTEGNLAKWTVKEGDKIKPGQVIAEIETDKATMEVEAVDSGVVGKIVINEGAKQVKVNSIIALLLEDGEDKKAIDSYVIKQPEAPKETANENKSKAPSAAPKAPTAAPQAPKAAPAPVAPVASAPSNYQPPVNNTGFIKASPLAKKVANLANVQLSMLKGTGPKGRIVKADVEDHLKRGGGNSGSSAGVVNRNPVEFVSIENNNIKQITAKRLLESKQTVPHFYLSIDCDVTDLNQARTHVNDLANGAYKVSVNDLVIKATALALKSIPAANSSWYDDAIVQYNNIDISVAVATPNGLITPIIFNADQKTVPQISNEMKELAKLARENKLKPQQFQGGGFSISNLGMFGIKQFNAIINPPQSCILAVGAGEDKVVIKDGNIEIANIMNVTLSVDHRSVDGAVGAQFLQEFKKFIENPITLFV